MKGGAQRVTEKREIFADRSIDSGYDTEREREGRQWKERIDKKWT